MSQRLRDEALVIWKAGVAAVDSERLVRDSISVDQSSLTVCGHRIETGSLPRLAVVGAGKAGAGMAAGVESALRGTPLAKKLTGWINVPEDCLAPTQHIHLHAARPAGVNEPTEEGVAGSREILDIASQLTDDDLCLVLLSGGGSALLPAPVEEVGLEAKQAVTRLLMKSGATIEQLNTVRKHLSRIKGGRLAAAIGARTTIALIISDVIGDPLDVIASGPTVVDRSTADEALAILRQFDPDQSRIDACVYDYLASGRSQLPANAVEFGKVHNHIIGNNRTAVAAAARKAAEYGYRVEIVEQYQRGEAAETGRAFVDAARHAAQGDRTQPCCLISGGEPTVSLGSASTPGRGGRNQELALAALQHLGEARLTNVVLLSGGTDGEDGPTDAAGALADLELFEAAQKKSLSIPDYLTRHDSYPFFEQIDGLLKTGPTHTNVMDLRVVLIAGKSTQS